MDILSCLFLEDGADTRHLLAHGLELAHLFQLGSSELEAGVQKIEALLGQFFAEFCDGQVAQFSRGLTLMAFFLSAI